MHGKNLVVESNHNNRFFFVEMYNNWLLNRYFFSFLCFLRGSFVLAFIYPLTLFPTHFTDPTSSHVALLHRRTIYIRPLVRSKMPGRVFTQESCSSNRRCPPVYGRDKLGWLADLWGSPPAQTPSSTPSRAAVDLSKQLLAT